jgi:hypothetical protein
VHDLAARTETASSPAELARLARNEAEGRPR